MEIYAELKKFLEEEMPGDGQKLRLYEDRQLPLKALYRMEKNLDNAIVGKGMVKIRRLSGD